MCFCHFITFLPFCLALVYYNLSFSIFNTSAFNSLEAKATFLIFNFHIIFIFGHSV